MIYKHNSPSSTKIKINSFHAESLFYVSGHVSYIGQPERISIVGISKKSKKRVFIRDVGSSGFNFENKVSLEIPDDIDVFININSSTEVWVDVDKLDIKENLKDRYSLLTTHLKDDAHINDSQLNNGKKIVCSHDVQSFSVNKSSISLSFSGADSILVEGFDQNKELLLRRKVKSGVAYPTIFRTNKKSSRIDYYINGKILADVIENKVEHLENIFEHTSSKLNDKSITAAMATYPAREHIYLDAVNSIIDQVDILYIYFNGYENVPDEILHHVKKEKIEYIISPRSTLRASGKFSWIGTIPGFHLTIDDDIIYPNNYVSALVNEAKAIDDENIIIGVHGSIFKKHVKDASKCREEIFNFQNELSNTCPVHMIGSGTALFTPSTSRLINVEELLSHPIANDELLAIQAKNIGIGMYCVKRTAQWLRSNTAMEFGVYEEKQLNKPLKNEVNTLVSKANPWPPL